ncbi:MAG: cold shock domain-containing protein [Bacteroidetes bacterium]|nr:MAG: cold shock domain-containing protein [Bacteroidota bacterium]
MFGGSSKASAKHTPTSSGGKKTGTIRYFNYKKGYGFIESKQMETDVFVHVKDLESRVRKGDTVRFSIVEEPKGPRATQVEVV